MNNTTVRVRFAPSPTGHLHIGGVRTALFNWLFARKYNGVFLIRYEDTDKERSTQEFLESQKASFEWLGLTPDEEPVIQSTRINRHLECIDKLIADGKAYEDDGAIRFRIPRDTQTFSFNDLIRGAITVPNAEVEDFVIRRSDGSPIYNLAVVVDDFDMGITHIIRGEDHVSNTFKQQLLADALGFSQIEFAHLPMIVGQSGKPLSKRDAVTSVTEYVKDGFLPGALLNYLVRLGWSHKDQEIFTIPEMIQLFDLKGVSSSAAVFDPKQLRWLNGMSIREAEQGVLINALKLVRGHDEQDKWEWSDTQLNQLITIYQPRVETLHDLHTQLNMLSSDPKEYDANAVSQWLNPDNADMLSAFYEYCSSAAQWEKENLLAYAKELLATRGLKLPHIAQPLRIAITGGTQSPGIFDIIYTLGKSTVIRRLRHCLERCITKRDI